LPKTKTKRPTAGSGVSGFVSLAMLHSPLDHPEPNPDEGGPCHVCTARCCRYIAMQIDKPAEEADYDHIRWYLMHEGIVVWADDEDWYLEVRTVCRHLRADNACDIYETRPQICRDYGLPGQDPCEYFTEHLAYDLFFQDDEAFDKWVKKEKKSKR